MWSVLLVCFTCHALAWADSSSRDMDDVYNNYPDLTQTYYNNLYQRYGMNAILKRLQALEANVRSGAVGGCESGVIGPFSPQQRSGQIKFRTQFASPPAVTLAVSDLSVVNASRDINFQIRPSALSPRSTNVNFIDRTNNLASAFVSYMACPNNANQPVKA